jgi:hypothetical protein
LFGKFKHLDISFFESNVLIEKFVKIFHNSIDRKTVLEYMVIILYFNSLNFGFTSFEFSKKEVQPI